MKKAVITLAILSSVNAYAGDVLPPEIYRYTDDAPKVKVDAPEQSYEQEFPFGQGEVSLGYSEMKLKYDGANLKLKGKKFGLSGIVNRYLSVNAEFIKYDGDTVDGGANYYDIVVDSGQLITLYANIGNYFEVTPNLYLKPFITVGGSHGSIKVHGDTESDNSLAYGYGLTGLINNHFAVTVEQRFMDFESEDITIDGSMINASVGYHF